MSNKSSSLKKGWIIAFQSHECKHCNRMQIYWEKFANSAHELINFGQVNCAVETKNGTIDEAEYDDEIYKKDPEANYRREEAELTK